MSTLTAVVDTCWVEVSALQHGPVLNHPLDPAQDNKELSKSEVDSNSAVKHQQQLFLSGSFARYKIKMTDALQNRRICVYRSMSISISINHLLNLLRIIREDDILWYHSRAKNILPLSEKF